MNDEIAVRADALTMRFGGFTAVDAVSFEVRRGEIFGFLGANGAGKSTTIRMLCGLLKPTSGTGTVAGYDIRTAVPQVKRSIGYMSQRFSLYDDITVRENIEFYGGVYGLTRKQIAEKTERLMTELQLEEAMDAPTRALPLGWKQRLALGTSLLHDPPIVFLDEPTGGVDPISRRNFWRIIYDMAAAGKTVFVSTHYMDEAEYCNRLTFMHQGRIIEMGNPTALKDKHGTSSIQEVFISLIRDADAGAAGGRAA